jgi:hypothetical protein
MVVSVGITSHFHVFFFYSILFLSNTFIDRRYLFGNIANFFELHVDGRNMDDDLFRFRPDAILILNIASYAAGTNPWQGTYDSLWCAGSRADDDRFRVQSCSDGYLEIIGFKHFELARIRLGRRGHRIAQGREKIRSFLMNNVSLFLM